MKARLLAPIAALYGAAALLADPTPNATVVGLAQDAKATADAVAPLALTVAGLILAVGIGVRLWKRFAR